MAVLLSWIGAIIAVIFGLPYGQYFIGNHSWLSGVMYMQIFIAISIPLLSIGFALWSLLRNIRPGIVRLKNRLWGLWVVNLIILISLASYFVRDIGTGGYINNTTVLEIPDEIMELDFLEYEANDALFIMDAGPFLLANNEFINKNVSIEFVPSEADIVITQTNFARERETPDAENTAQSIAYKINQSGSKIQIPKYFNLAKGNQWRNQKVKLKFALPIGQKVKIAAEQRYKIQGLSVRNCTSFEQYYYLEMTANGLACVER